LGIKGFPFPLCFPFTFKQTNVFPIRAGAGHVLPLSDQGLDAFIFRRTVLHLSRLTAVGFKSFAHKLDLSLRQGITCVVGPNGCGKSNVVDALRWALGEQRARSLRSSNMEDVIFSGSRSRKPLGMAEVSVTIDNANKILPVDFTEVTVTRRLFRSGDSDYLLNKVPCRLKDIHNLLMDTGLGAHAYSVIEQGMVDEIISDKPEERRRLFEEAAGVTRYKVRRRSAWNKLESIQQDLQRIEDIIGEVERQVNSLKRQERKARLYKQLSDQFREMEIHLGQFMYHDMSDRARPLLEEMTFLKEDIEVGGTDIARLGARVEEVRTELTAQDQALAAANAEVSRQTEVVHRKDREILVARSESQNIVGFLERAARQREEMGERQEAALSGQHTAEQDRREASSALEQTEKALTDANQALEGLSEALEIRRSEGEEKKKQLMSILEQISDKNGRLERGRAEIEGLAHRRARLAEDAGRVQFRKQESDESGAEATRQIIELEEAATEKEKQRKAWAGERSQQLEEQVRLTERRNELNAQQEADGARLALLKRLREGFEGYSRGVRALAVDSPYTSKIKGILADAVAVNSAYTQAIEAALGRALECLVVDSADDALEAIDYLSNGGHGAAAFLPMDRVLHSGGTPWVPPKGEGVIGRASDLLSKNSLASALLHQTLLVTDSRKALELSPAMCAIGVDIVTLNGELFSPEGTIFGGVAEGEETNLIGRTQEIETLEAGLADGAEDLARVTGEIQHHDDILAELTRHIGVSDENLSELRNRQSGLNRDRENARTESERQVKLAAELEEEREKLASRETELIRIQDAAEGEVSGLGAQRTRIEDDILQADEVLREQEQQRRAQQDVVAGHRVEMASLRARAERQEVEAQRLAREQSELARELERLETECAESESRKRKLDETVEEASAEMQGLHKIQTKLEQKRDTQAQGQQELMKATREVEEELRSINQRVNQNQERLRGQEVELAQLKTKAEELQSRLQRDYDVDVKELGRLDLPEFNADITGKRVLETQERLRRMGSVNLAALDEYDLQKERFEFLAQQRDDLLEAEETLKRTISKIDRTARGRFMETFNEIRANFHKTFAAFFVGGEADLLMPSDEDPLEAPLQIIARPRGKQLQNINLLSGGERALTAISLLFAIYLVKPSPFCILDEVDAPLDDANVTRFVKVIKQFARDVQFIVVTHNKGTMEAADCLHGVTMEEPGVSKLVSVKLAEEEKSGNGQVQAVLEVEPADD